MTVVLVTGGSGVLGSALVPLLADAGHDVRTHTGDLNTGAGVAAAVEGAEVIVHAASDTRRFGRSDVDQTRHLMQAASAAPTVQHIVYVSIVGIDSIPLYYYLRKLACEGVVAASGIPFTIQRATQFHELIELLIRTAGRLAFTPLPLDFKFQTIAAREAAVRIAELAGARPRGRALDIGGPQVQTLAEMVATWQAAGLPGRKIVRLPVPGRVGDAFRRGLNTCPDQASDGETWSEFVVGRAG
jgi:uncharacterized protein YbjT (DUF2867 family)